MPVSARFALWTVTALTALLPALAPTPARGQPPIVTRREPVGSNRVPRVAVPRPVPTPGGGVFVPRALRLIPTLELDRIVADDAVRRGADGEASLPPDWRAAPVHAAIIGANVRANDTGGDPPGMTQSETTIAALGANLVAAWNDGHNFGASPGGTGWAYSTNGGLSWTDGGVLPVPGGTALHQGDPVLTRDAAGNFYCADLYTPDNSNTSAIAVCRGSFSGGSFAWGLPVMIASTTTDFLDKAWIAADEQNGIVYASWTRFLAAGDNQIEFSRSTTNGASWDPIQVLTLPSVENVQGSRIAVGPNHEVQVMYIVYDRASGNNYMRTRRSTTLGASFGPEVTLPAGPSGIQSNYGSGPPGFNRAGGIGFPSLAIDRTAGPNSGRIYATWEETVNFYADPLGTLGPINETEPNNTSAEADPISIGQEFGGFLTSTSDQDWFSFTGTAGQTVILYLTPGAAPEADGFLRLFAGGSDVENRAALSHIGFGTGLIVYTLPATGTYDVRVLANTSSVGNYVVHTGFDTPDPGDEIARDTRDAVIQTSLDGVTWDARRIVNDDPPRFDNAFPEVAVDGSGHVFVDWYDHRADPLGIGTDLVVARSATAGASFLPGDKVNDGPATNWNVVASNLSPNLGDYSALVADGCYVYASFADGRDGTPDSWLARIDGCGPASVTFASVEAWADRVDLLWSTGAGEAMASVHRRAPEGDWVVLGSVHADAWGQLRYRDRSVQPGARYEYRIGVAGAGGMEFSGNVWVSVPWAARLAIQRPVNPVRGELTVSFTLQGSEPATLELLDVAGRSVESVPATAGQPARLGARGLAPGVYVVRLSQGGRSVTAKAVVLR